MIGSLLLFSLSSSPSEHVSEKAVPQITPAPAGPYHLRGNQILDATGHDYLIRGTSLPSITWNALDSGNDGEFGPFSGTTLITIRQRLNMNAVRLQILAQEYKTSDTYRARVKEIVRRANQLELLAIIERDSVTKVPAEGVDSFWVYCAEEFRISLNVFFALSPEDNAERLVSVIRASGAAQPIIVSGINHLVDDPNVIYQVSPSFLSVQTDQIQYSLTSVRIPMLVNGLDPHLDRAGPECSDFPRDPDAASRLIEGVLEYFDQHTISWTISALEPGKLIDNFRNYDWRKLDDGWTCGESPAHTGIAMALLSHLWRADPHGLFTVNQPAGGFVIARGANSSAYGRTLAQREAQAHGTHLPLKLGDVTVRVTDSRGVARLAPLSWTGAGWSTINLVIPADAALGPADVTVVREDGSQTRSRIIIANVAPGLWTATQDGRGPVIGQVSQRFTDGGAAQFPSWTCSKGHCQTVPIPLTHRASTSVRIEGTGFRFASSKAAVHVTIDGIAVPVESFGPVPESSLDHVTIRLPDELIGHGEADLLLIADGALSNVVRINCDRR